MGAGVLPFSVNRNRVQFLFQTTFSGRKAGHYIDFGGGLGEDEDFRTTAVREFIEETETMYFADDLNQARRTTARVNHQVPLVDALFTKTLSRHPEWCLTRDPGDPPRAKQWKTFLIEFPYRDVSELNRQWQRDDSGRFRKRRELFWIEAGDLLSIYRHRPEKLWKRVRQLEAATVTIEAIVQYKMNSRGSMPINE